MSFINKIFNILPNLDFIDKDGNTLLHIAVNENNIEMVIKILEKIQNSDTDILNKQNNEGNTPFHLSIKNGNNDIAVLLDQMGADKTIRNNDGEFIDDATENENVEIVNFQFKPVKCKQNNNFNNLDFVDVLYALSNNPNNVIMSEPIEDLKRQESNNTDPFLDQLLTQYITQHNSQHNLQHNLLKGGSMKKIFNGTRYLK